MPGFQQHSSATHTSSAAVMLDGAQNQSEDLSSLRAPDKVLWDSAPKRDAASKVEPPPPFIDRQETSLNYQTERNEEGDILSVHPPSGPTIYCTKPLASDLLPNLIRRAEQLQEFFQNRIDLPLLQNKSLSTPDGLRYTYRNDQNEIELFVTPDKVLSRAVQYSSIKPLAQLQRLTQSLRSNLFGQHFTDNDSETVYTTTPLSASTKEISLRYLNNRQQEDQYRHGRLYERLCYSADYSQLHASRYAKNEKIRRSALWKLNPQGAHLLKSGEHFPTGKMKWIHNHQRRLRIEYDEAGEAICRVRFKADGKTVGQTQMLKPGEAPLGTITEERKKSGSLSSSEYLNLLADRLNTYRKLEVFLNHFMRYTPDGEQDTWQSAGATVERVSGGQMLGDCEDYAFLTRSILRRQGHKAHVLLIPKHALCLWIDQDTSGAYHAHTLGTFGYDRNGHANFLHEDSDKGSGFSNAEDAIRAVLKKYERRGLGVSKPILYELDPERIIVAGITRERKQSRKKVTVEHLLNS